MPDSTTIEWSCVAAAGYAYTGGTEMYYQQYMDNATGKMLVAQPGGVYDMFACDTGPADDDGVPTALPVPPMDGRWAGAPPPPPPIITPVPVQPPQPVTASAPATPAPQGGES